MGRTTIRETDVYSTNLAVQNLWLAARAEGVGIGWMSIMEPPVVRDILGIPDHVIPVAYLTVGWPVDLPETPMLVRVGWRKRLALKDLIFEDQWGKHGSLDSTPSAKTPRVRIADPIPPSTAVKRNEELTKPIGSLGRLEQLAMQLCGLQGTSHPSIGACHLVLFAADHGVTQEGVSAYRPEVTARMVRQFVCGGAAVNALARENAIEVTVVDVGVDADFGDATAILHHKISRGTKNMAIEPAMTTGETTKAVSAGRSAVASLGELDVLALGEMGIGNTTAAAALTAVLLGLKAEDVVGIGTGIGQKTRLHKVEVVEKAIKLHNDQTRTVLGALGCLGGFEIAAMVGAIQEAVDRGAMVVLDGYITGVSALIAVKLDPKCVSHMVAAHCSSEPGAKYILDALGLDPLFDLQLRLGEGSGAVIATGLVKSAARVMNDMSTFDEAGIVNPIVKSLAQ